MLEPEKREGKTLLQQCASIERSVLSVAVVVGHIQVSSWRLQSDHLSGIYALAPHAARPALRWLMMEAGFTRRELYAALRRGLLVWDAAQGRLVYGMTWQRRLAAALVCGLGLGFAAAKMHLILYGAHSFRWGVIVALCGAITAGALCWLQRHYVTPRGIALRVVDRLAERPGFPDKHMMEKP